MNELDIFKEYIAESYYKQISILDKIIGNRHWLTTGTYKEKVLINFLNNKVPEKIGIKSGFIAFPQKNEKVNINEKITQTVESGYYLSKQIDIIVYYKEACAPIYEDENILIISPKSVIAVIEVKGIFNNEHVAKSIENMEDFCIKWNKYCDEFEINNKPPLVINYYWDYGINKRIKDKTVLKKLEDNLKLLTSSETYRKKAKINSLFIFNYASYKLIQVIDDNSILAGYNIKRIDEHEKTEIKDFTLYQLLKDILFYSGIDLDNFIFKSETSATKIPNDNFNAVFEIDPTEQQKVIINAMK